MAKALEYVAKILGLKFEEVIQEHATPLGTQVRLHRWLREEELALVLLREP